MGLECQGPTGSPWAKALAVIGTWLGELELWGGRRCWWFRSGKCALEPDFYVFFPETVGNFIIPTGELHHFFRGVGQPPTSDWFCLKSWPFICVSQKNQRKSPEEPAEKKQLPPLFLRQSPQSSPGPTGVLVCVFFTAWWWLEHGWIMTFQKQLGIS